MGAALLRQVAFARAEFLECLPMKIQSSDWHDFEVLERGSRNLLASL